MLKVANSVINASQITGVLPVVNGGTGVTTSTGTGNTVLSASPTLSGDVNLSTGNLVIGTSGKGIDFSATAHAAGMTSELFDDYEVGTFTPTVVGSTTAGTATYTNQTGRYTKIGNRVVISIALDYSLHTGTGDMRISGLPYSSAANDVVAMFASSLTFTGTHLQPFTNTTQILLSQTSSTLSDSYIPVDAACQLIISGSYRTS